MGNIDTEIETSSIGHFWAEIILKVNNFLSVIGRSRSHMNEIIKIKSQISRLFDPFYRWHACWQVVGEI